MAMSLARKLRVVRRQMKYSQQELAERSGVSLGSLKRFERTGSISLESLLKIMHLLGRLSEFGPLLQPKENLDEIKKLFSK